MRGNMRSSSEWWRGGTRIAQAAFMRAELIEVHVARADELATAILEYQPFRPPTSSAHL
jgi:hypothetical protein